MTRLYDENPAYAGRVGMTEDQEREYRDGMGTTATPGPIAVEATLVVQAGDSREEVVSDGIVLQDDPEKNFWPAGRPPSSIMKATVDEQKDAVVSHANALSETAWRAAQVDHKGIGIAKDEPLETRTCAGPNCSALLGKDDHSQECRDAHDDAAYGHTSPPVTGNKAVNMGYMGMHEGESFHEAFTRLLKHGSLATTNRRQVTPNNDEVICPNCTTQFRAIPVNVQGLLKQAGYEPPYLSQAREQTDAEKAIQGYAIDKIGNQDLAARVYATVGAALRYADGLSPQAIPHPATLQKLRALMMTALRDIKSVHPQMAQHDNEGQDLKP